MNNLKISILLFAVFIFAAFASAETIMVMKLRYNNGNITLINSTIKEGFSEKNNYHGNDSFRAEILNNRNRVLYEAKIKAPNVMYVDADVNGTMTGGKIVLEKVDFALVTPYFKEGSKIRFYNSSSILPTLADIAKAEEKSSNISIPLTIIVILAILIIIGFIIYKRKQ